MLHSLLSHAFSGVPCSTVVSSANVHHNRISSPCILFSHHHCISNANFSHQRSQPRLSSSFVFSSASDSLFYSSLTIIFYEVVHLSSPSPHFSLSLIFFQTLEAFYIIFKIFGQNFEFSSKSESISRFRKFWIRNRKSKIAFGRNWNFPNNSFFDPIRSICRP